MKLKNKIIIGTDFSGTVIKEIGMGKTHEEWFRTMSILLKDKKIQKLAGKKDYFLDVEKIMQRYTGLDAKNEEEKKLMTKFARNLFQMIYLREAIKQRQKLTIKEYVKLLREIKKKYKIALITTTPEEIVDVILNKLNVKEIFDYVYKSPLHQKPNKKELLAQFEKERGRLSLYIGNSQEDEKACQELKIRFTKVDWGSETKNRREIKKVKEEITKISRID